MHISACASSGLSQNIDRWQKLFNVIRLMSISFRHNYILKTNCSYCDVNELLNEPPSTHCRESKKRYNNKWSILCRTWWFEKLHTHHALQKDNNPGFACSPCITVIHSHIPVLTLQWKLDTHRVLEWMCYTLKTQWDKTMQGAGGRKYALPSQKDIWVFYYASVDLSELYFCMQSLHKMELQISTQTCSLLLLVFVKWSID